MSALPLRWQQICKSKQEPGARDCVGIPSEGATTILAMAEVRKKAEDAGTMVETMSPAQLGDFTRQELDHWGRVIKAAKITAD